MKTSKQAARYTAYTAYTSTAGMCEQSTAYLTIIIPSTSYTAFTEKSVYVRKNVTNLDHFRICDERAVFFESKTREHSCGGGLSGIRGERF